MAAAAAVDNKAAEQTEYVPVRAVATSPAPAGSSESSSSSAAADDALVEERDSGGDGGGVGATGDEGNDRETLVYQGSVRSGQQVCVCACVWGGGSSRVFYNSINRDIYPVDHLKIRQSIN